MSYTLTPQQYRAAKSALTRAINKRDAHFLLDVCESARTLFDACGYPDDWSRWPRALADRAMGPTSIADKLRREEERWYP